MTQARADTAYIGLGVVVGALLGWFGARVLPPGSGLSLIPWTVAGLSLGAWSRSARFAAGVGACFGFVLALTFMVAGYDGDDPLAAVLVPFLVLGLVGALCGAVLAVAGRFGARLLRQRA